MKRPWKNLRKDKEMDTNKVKALNIMYGDGGCCGKTSSLIEKLRANRLPLHQKCFGGGDIPPCSHATKSGDTCEAYFDPSAKWRLGDCPLADLALKTKEETKKVTVNALKASKRAAKGQ